MIELTEKEFRQIEHLISDMEHEAFHEEDPHREEEINADVSALTKALAVITQQKYEMGEMMREMSFDSREYK